MEGIPNEAYTVLIPIPRGFNWVQNIWGSPFNIPVLWVPPFWPIFGPFGPLGWGAGRFAGKHFWGGQISRVPMNWRMVLVSLESPWHLVHI